MGKQKFYTDPTHGGSDGTNFVKYEQNTTESEDRLFSSEPVIREINQYIKRIDILLSTKRQFNGELSIDIFNNLEILALARKILSLRRNIVYVYINENDFNSRNNKTINEWLENQYSLPRIERNSMMHNSSYDLFKILQFINYAEDKNMQGKERNNVIGDNIKMLKHYHLDKFIPTIARYYKSFIEKDFTAKNISLNHILQDLRNYDKEDYVLIVKMVDDFFQSHGYKNQNDVIDKKEKEYYRNNYGRGIDYEKVINMFAFKPIGQSDSYGNTIILNPDKTPFWSLFDDDYKLFFIQDVTSNVIKHGSKDDESFYKYIQHLTKSSISVTQMLNIINKLSFDDYNVIENTFGGNFTHIKLTYLNVDNQKYLSKNDKEIVESMFEE